MASCICHVLCVTKRLRLERIVRRHLANAGTQSCADKDNILRALAKDPFDSYQRRI